MSASNSGAIPVEITAGASQKSPFWWIGYVPAVLFLLCLAAITIKLGGSVLIPLLLAFAITLLLEPLAAYFQRGSRERTSAVLLALFTAIVIVALILLFLLPSVFHQLRESFEKLPLALRAGAARAQSLLDFAKHRLNPDMFARLQSAVTGFQNDPAALTTRVGGWLSKGLLGLVDVGSAALGLIIVPFFVYYLLRDLDKLRAFVEHQIPPRFRSVGMHLFHEIGVVVRGYVRGRFLIACIMAVIYATGLLILRVPLWAGIGIISGVIGIIPYLGVTSGLILALSFAALDGAGLARVLGVVVVFSIAQLTEDYVLTPRIIGGKLDLHPMLVFLALIVSGDMFGLLGLVLAIPALAVIKVIVKFLDDLYLQSGLYLDPAKPPGR